VHFVSGGSSGEHPRESSPADDRPRAKEKTMTLMQWLNKLGILRWGTKAAVYHNAREKPIELMDVGVFNARRDLTFGGEQEKQLQQEAAAKKAAK
jgi:hypothetical protein